MKSAPLRIFISRALVEDSVFSEHLRKELLGKKKIEIIAHSCLTFSPMTFSIPEEFDAICFYSQKGFDYFLKGLPKNFNKISSSKLIAFGKATAAVMEKKGWYPSLVGNGNAEDLAPLILEKFQHQKILFPQAKYSKDSLKPWLEGKLEYIPLVTYSNDELAIPNLGKFQCLVFTSPKNVLSFSQSNEFAGKIIAIGASTAAQLLELTDKPILIAKAPYEAELAKAVIKSLEL